VAGADDHLISRRRALALFGVGALAPLGACSSPSSAPAPAPAPPPAAAPGPAADAAGVEPLHYLSLQQVAARLAAREMSPVALTERMLARIGRVDARLKSYATVMATQALADARAAEQEIAAGRYRGPLHGVPVAVKDLCYTRGVRTMGGTPVLKDFVPDVDATVVARLRSAGAVILGKLNLTEGAMAGYHPDMGIPINPWDDTMWPGLSSSGSGVAVAAGLCFSAIGTDTGGSIRFPSGANGVVGLKPTYGRVSRFGVLPLAESLDHVGPMARTVADVAIMFEAMAGHDPNDATSLAEPAPGTMAELGRDVKGVRIGIDRKYHLTGIDAEQIASIEEALKVLAGLGARIVDVRMPDLRDMETAWFMLASSEAAAAHQANFPSRADEYGLYFREVLQIGTGWTEAQLAGARKIRERITAAFNRLLQSVDALACPTGGSPAWPITRELQVGPLSAYMAAWDKASPRNREFPAPMNLAGTPAICLPSGFTAEGLPLSIQFAGRRLSEPMLCRIAHAYEQATTWHDRHPDVSAT
jgi:amidase